MPKKLLLLNTAVAAALVVSMVIVSTGAVSAQPVHAAKAHATVQLTLAGWASSSAEPTDLQKVVNSFNKKYPSIHVTLEEINSNFEQSVETQIAGGGGPDVFYLDQGWGEDLERAGDLVPLEGYAKNDKPFDVKDFAPGLLRGFQWKGKQYAYPKDYSTLGLQYNRGLFDRFHIKSAPKTWKEFATDACKATDKSAGIYGAALPPDMARWGAFLFGMGGGFVNQSGTKSEIMQKGAMLKLVKDWGGLVKEGCARIPSSKEGWGGGAFQSNKVAMVFEGNWITGAMSTPPYNKIRYGVAEIPTGPTGKRSDWNYCVGYAMNKNTKHRAASWTLLSYLTGKTGEKQWVDLFGVLPARKSIKAPAGTKEYVAGAPVSYPYQEPTGFFSASGPYTPINNAMQEYGDGSITAQQAVTDMNNAVNAWIQAPK